MISYGGVYLSPDIPSLAREWRNSERIWHYCRQNSLISKPMQDEWLKKIGSDSSIKMFGLKKTDGDEPIGVAGLTSISTQNANAEFSLYIAPEYQGRGHSRDALIALIGHGFLDLRLERIWGEVFDYNTRALNCFSKIGFVEEGTLRNSYFKEGKFIDSKIISMLRKEFDEKYIPLKQNQQTGGDLWKMLKTI